MSYRATEFLKLPIMQSHDCWKWLKICAKAWLKKAKPERLEFFFLSFLKIDNFKKKFWIFLWPFLPMSFKNSECAKEFSFRKSAGSPCLVFYSNIRYENFCSSSSVRPVSRSPYPPWILKPSWLESSCQRLISINSKTKRIEFFGNLIQKNQNFK